MTNGSVIFGKKDHIHVHFRMQFDDINEKQNYDTQLMKGIHIIRKIVLNFN